jgi:hypothetical protein
MAVTAKAVVAEKITKVATENSKLQHVAFSARFQKFITR